MADKLNMVREYIFGELSAGRLKGGDKLPGAREFSRRIGVSHAVTQMAFQSLARDGILNSIPRSGSFIRNDWKMQLIPDSFFTFRPFWAELLEGRLPGGLNIHNSFNSGVFEIKTTAQALQRRNEYMDLSGIFQEIYPDPDDFFVRPFASFRTVSNGLFAIPLIFSPRMMCYNPEMLADAGCPEPRSGWGWDEFIEDLIKLRRLHPAERIFNLEFDFSGANFIFRAGGGFFDSDGKTVRLDSPETMNGIAKVRQIYEALDIHGQWPADKFCRQDFYAGKCAFFMAPRQDVRFDAEYLWKCVPLPLIPGGTDVSLQSTDLLCVRRQGADLETVREVVRLLLSTAVQDQLGTLKYGIPIRKSSAMNSFSPEDSRDAVFLSEMPKISAEFNFESTEMLQLVFNGLHEIWLNGADPETTVGDIASALRTMVKYRNFSINKEAMK